MKPRLKNLAHAQRTAVKIYKYGYMEWGTSCRRFNADCAKCRLHQFLGLLEWFCELKPTHEKDKPAH
jgi:hypothetical protein